jgi:hypothetical protein
VRHKIGILSFCFLLAACSGVKNSSTSGGQSGSGSQPGAGSQPTPASLAGLSVTPSAVSIAAAATVSLHAMGTYSDGSTKDLTSSVTWSS